MRKLLDWLVPVSMFVVGALFICATEAATYKVGVNEAYSSVDNLPRLNNGDFVLLAAGETSLATRGLKIDADNVAVGTLGTGARHVVKASGSAFIVGGWADKTRITGVNVESKLPGVFVYGTNTTVKNLAQLGEGSIVEGRSAKFLWLDDCDSTNGKLRSYGFYFGGTCANVILTRSDVNVLVGEHVLRSHGTTNLVIGDAAGSSWNNFTYGSPYKGHALNIRDNAGVHVIRCKVRNTTSGPKFGPLPTNPSGPNDPNLRLTGLVVEKCDFNSSSFWSLERGCEGFIIRDNVIRTDSSYVFNVESRGPTSRPVASGNITNNRISAKGYPHAADVRLTKGDAGAIAANGNTLVGR